MPEKFVLMEKDGERLEVHPATVKAHEAVGWKVVEAKPEPKPEKAAVAEESPADEATAEKKKK